MLVHLRPAVESYVQLNVNDHKESKWQSQSQSPIGRRLQKQSQAGSGCCAWRLSREEKELEATERGALAPALALTADEEEDEEEAGRVRLALLSSRAARARSATAELVSCKPNLALMASAIVCHVIVEPLFLGASCSKNARTVQSCPYDSCQLERPLFLLGGSASNDDVDDCTADEDGAASKSEGDTSADESIEEDEEERIEVEEDEETDEVRRARTWRLARFRCQQRPPHLTRMWTLKAPVCAQTGEEQRQC